MQRSAPVVMLLRAMPARSVARSRNPHVQLWIGIAAIVLGLALIAAVPQLRHCVVLVANGRFTGLRNYIQSLGAGGVLLLLGLMVAHAIVFYPSEIITTTSGYVYGFLPGLGLAVGGWFVSAMVSYALGRTVGGPLLRRLLGRRFEWLERTMERGGISLLLSGRLIPIVPFALVGYAAGATHTNPVRFGWTTVVGYLPLTLAVSYLGSQAKTFSAGDPLVWLAVAVIVGMLVAERIVRHQSAKRRRVAEGLAGGEGAAAGKGAAAGEGLMASSSEGRAGGEGLRGLDLEPRAPIGEPGGDG